jgi:hypothetical protein
VRQTNTVEFSAVSLLILSYLRHVVKAGAWNWPTTFICLRLECVEPLFHTSWRLMLSDRFIHEEYYLLGCLLLISCVAYSSIWRWRQHVSPKRRWTTRPHDVTYQKIVLFIFIAVRISGPTISIFVVLDKKYLTKLEIFFNWYSGGVESNWVHSALWSPIGLLCQPRVIMMMEKLVEWLAKETEVLGENLRQCSFVHHTPHMLPGREPGPLRLESSD